MPLYDPKVWQANAKLGRRDMWMDKYRPIFTGTASYPAEAGQHSTTWHIQRVQLAAILHISSDAKVPSLRFPKHPHLLFQEDPGLFRQVVSQ